MLPRNIGTAIAPQPGHCCCIAKLIPTDIATKHLVLPLKRDGRTLTVAMADPTNMGAVDDLKFLTRYDVVPVIAGEFTLRHAIEKHYGSADEQQLQSLMSQIEGMGGDTGDVDREVSGCRNGAGDRAHRPGASPELASVEHERRARVEAGHGLLTVRRRPVPGGHT